MPPVKKPDARPFIIRAEEPPPQKPRAKGDSLWNEAFAKVLEIGGWTAIREYQGKQAAAHAMAYLKNKGYENRFEIVLRDAETEAGLPVKRIYARPKVDE